MEGKDALLGQHRLAAMNCQGFRWGCSLSYLEMPMGIEPGTGTLPLSKGPSPRLMGVIRDQPTLEGHHGFTISALKGVTVPLSLLLPQHVLTVPLPPLKKTHTIPLSALQCRSQANLLHLLKRAREPCRHFCLKAGAPGTAEHF